MGRCPKPRKAATPLFKVSFYMHTILYAIREKKQGLFLELVFGRYRTTKL